MKKYLFTFISGLLCLTALASPPLASKQQIGMFINSKTCVVLESGDISYNVLIKDAVTKYWKFTKYEFIDLQEFEKRRFDSKYSFLVLMKGVFDKDPSGISYNYVSLVLGDTANDMTNMPEFCSIPISYSDDSENDYGYALPAIIKFMQIHIKTLQNKRFLVSLSGLKYYNNNSSKFKAKVLLLNKNKLASDANTPEKIKTVYLNNLKLLTTSEIQKEVAANPENTLFHFHVGPTKDTGAGKCFEMIFDNDGNLYYYNTRKVTNDKGDGFTLNDFSNIR